MNNFGEINYKVFEDVVENKKVDEKEVFNKVVPKGKKEVKKNRSQKKNPSRRRKTRNPKV
tara:strand:+ start:354 stop:533 length:180 start_codon:yes stop_codon:yes gene_type:complete